MSQDRAQKEAAAVLERVPPELRFGADEDTAKRWMTAPVTAWRSCEAAIRNLMTLHADTASLRLLTFQATEVMIGISHSLEGLALLVGDVTHPARRSRGRRLRVPDWLPSMLNGARAFLIIGSVTLFWVITAWPNGAFAIVWASIVVILFAPRADQAYAGAIDFTIGNAIAASCAAVMNFAIFPRLNGFTAFSLALGSYLIPAGALMAQPWRAALFTAMAANFVPLVAPANQESYNTIQFYNSSLALLVGSTVGALSFRVLPPLSPAYRARRLLTLTLRDLRRLTTEAVSMTRDDWRSHVYGRLEVMPEQAAPLQRAELLAALSVGSAVIQLRRITSRLDLDTTVEGALDAFVRGDTIGATTGLAKADRLLEERWGSRPVILRARAIILAISEAVQQHREYFGTQPQ
jgi:uncharacterized membrane protein YccC